MQNNNIGFIYKEAIDSTELEKYVELLQEHFYTDGVINCPYIENGNMIDSLTLIPKNISKKVKEEANYEAS